ncbi:hypothetical protein BLS_002201 [Venturia inaequalis]|uniref:AA1-like domain-containing protein n=1 Tax=Venturia inaequalis TaxID=5025 RepID=A0A8H3VCL5_VENIN|nr:hypothetical protein EG328_011387 [Venturia inaequalis]KAE9984499.1 hypothetical protein BLS_002201 [Venturia inaequalis]KAE9989945.1 hypothetical protein EG327_002087 [Venturia inaequalis]
MQFSTALLSLAALATFSSANPVPQSGFTGTSKWWYWTVTDLTLTSTPLVPKYQYKFNIQHYSQTLKANCSGPAEKIVCSDQSYTISVQEGPFKITQKLYQSSGLATLTGETKLNVSCLASDGVSPEFTKTVCTDPAFKVDSNLVQ